MFHLQGLHSTDRKLIRQNRPVAFQRVRFHAHQTAPLPSREFERRVKLVGLAAEFLAVLGKHLWSVDFAVLLPLTQCLRRRDSR